MIIDDLKETHSWHLFEYANKHIGVFKRYEPSIREDSPGKIKVWNKDLCYFFQNFGVPYRQLWDLDFVDICDTKTVSPEGQEFIDIARLGEIAYSISTQSCEIYKTSPALAYCCSSAVSFIFWGTVRMAFFDKYAEEDLDDVRREYEILVNEFLETESLARKYESDIWIQIEEICSFWR